MVIELTGTLVDVLKGIFKDRSIKRLYKLPLCFILIFDYLWMMTPFFSALTIIAFRKYQETPMYTERRDVFGHDFAIMSYVENKEQGMFMRKLKWRDKLRAYTVPYSIINEYENEQE